MTDKLIENREIVLLKESNFALDGGAMFGIIPRPLWERTNPPDERNRISMAARCVLIRDKERLILIDVGMGTTWSEKEREIYRVEAQDPGLIRSLKAQGVAPEEITDVILTHLHFDHAGGLARKDESGRGQANFPNARHWVQRRNWSWANSPSARDAGSYRKEDFDLFEGAQAPPLELVDGVDEILPGIEVFPVHGHTMGMQTVKITCPDATYFFMADLIPTSSHLRDPYVMGYDLQPLLTVDEKRELLYHTRREGWILLFSHDPQTPAGRVELDRRGQPTLAPLNEVPTSLKSGL